MTGPLPGHHCAFTADQIIAQSAKRSCRLGKAGGGGVVLSLFVIGFTFQHIQGFTIGPSPNEKGCLNSDQPMR